LFVRKLRPQLIHTIGPRNRLRNRLAQKAAVPHHTSKVKSLVKNSDPAHKSGPIQAVKSVTAAQINKKNQASQCQCVQIG
jgi:hypothetical protein